MIKVLKISLADWINAIFFGMVSLFAANYILSGSLNILKLNVEYPYIYWGDSLIHSIFIKMEIEGSILHTGRLGYPFGLDIVDFPNADYGNNLIIKFISNFSNQYFTVYNIFYLLSFPLSFVASYSVSRDFKLNKITSVLSAFTFTLLPYHFFRIGHLFLAQYFIIPLFFYIGFRISKLYSLYYDKSVKIWKKIIIILLLPLLGCFGVYYAIFGVILILLSSLIVSSVYKKNKLILFSLKIVFIVLTGTILNLTSNIIHQIENGKNANIGHNNTVASELYGFKLVQLILPHEENNISINNEISNKYNKNYPLINENRISSLGFIGSIGFIFLLINLIHKSTLLENNFSINYLTRLNIGLLLFGLVGGVGVLLSCFIPEIRAWNRISIFINFACILAFYLAISAALSNIEKYISISIIFLIFMFGLYEQVPKFSYFPKNNSNSTFQIAKNFVISIENIMPKGSAIYQMPYIPFPEGVTINRLASYDLGVGFLNSNYLRWSFGSMKGRAGDLFYSALSKESITKQIEVIKKLGFSGVYIDRRGYSDNGDQVINELENLLGAKPALISEDKNVYFYKMNVSNGLILGNQSLNQIMKKGNFIVDNLGVRYQSNRYDQFKLSNNQWPSFVSTVSGLSGPESWGRWSDSNQAYDVQICFDGPLPNKFKILMLAQPFGPNANQNSILTVGAKKYKFMLPPGFSNINIEVNTEEDLARCIKITPPSPTAPNEIGLSPDSRKLGIGISTFQMVPISK
ncbi:hypothetical protein ICV00_04795 [Polynucleobacter asymbioticus]|nr:hypothetical protein ICV00_04795 [Polynucleobacter asymbioticus]